MAAEKKYSANFCKTNTKLSLRLYCNHDNSYFFANREEIYKFKPDNKNVNFQINFAKEENVINLMLLNLGTNLLKQCMKKCRF